MSEPTPIIERQAYRDGVLVGVQRGRIFERTELMKQIENQICFDAIADSDGRCENHGGKCYELRQLINKLEKKEEENGTTSEL